jgi:queuine/archaeosine tRNA-ribosyltransferase
MEDIRFAIEEGRYKSFKKERLELLHTYEDKKD